MQDKIWFQLLSTIILLQLLDGTLINRVHHVQDLKTLELITLGIGVPILSNWAEESPFWPNGKSAGILCF